MTNDTVSFRSVILYRYDETVLYAVLTPISIQIRYADKSLVEISEAKSNHN